jgi:Predicted metal-binding integral membrane protein (DUF2182)
VTVDADDAAAATEQTSAAVAAAVAITLVAAGVAWVVPIERMSGMNMGVETRLGSLASFALVWLSMMAAMMLPGAVPAVVRRARADGLVPAAIRFNGAYLVVWMAAGAAVYALYRPHGTVAAGALVLAAGVYELAIDRSVAVAIVGLGVLILVAPRSVPGLTPAM